MNKAIAALMLVILVGVTCFPQTPVGSPEEKLRREAECLWEEVVRAKSGREKLQSNVLRDERTIRVVSGEPIKKPIDRKSLRNFPQFV